MSVEPFILACMLVTKAADVLSYLWSINNWISFIFAKHIFYKILGDSAEEVPFQ